jgi:phosphoketolase
MSDSLSPELLRKIHAYWRAANYLSVRSNEIDEAARYCASRP